MNVNQEACEREGELVVFVYTADIIVKCRKPLPQIEIHFIRRIYNS